MYLSRILIFTLLDFLLKTQFCFSQEAASARNPDFITYSDTTKRIFPATTEEFKVDIRLLSGSILEKYKNDPEFNYDNKSKEAEDWITKIRNWINQMLNILRSSKVYSTLLDYFYYALMIIGLILIVRGFIKGDRRGLLFGKAVNSEIKMIEHEEDINQLNFDDLITNAIENKHYKLAIRYLFLKSLKLLSGKGLIEIRNNKTNHQYLSEIKNERVANTFQDATLIFEWIWYGDFPVDEDIMKYSQNVFSKLFGLIKS
jgi:hypothetical protein